jgi:5-methyltetrahydrofolate--homocysteine methyltransferase
MSDDQLTESHHIWLREAARDQRRRATPTEQRLWAVLRGRKLSGWRFRRQDPIGPYIADFLCAEAHLIVEIDGSVHEDQQEYDAERDDYLHQLGYRVLRVSALQVSRDLPGALAVIEGACQAPPLPRTWRGGRGVRGFPVDSQ